MDQQQTPIIPPQPQPVATPQQPPLMTPPPATTPMPTAPLPPQQPVRHESSLLKWVFIMLIIIFFVMGIGTFVFIAYNNAVQSGVDTTTYNPPAPTVPSPTQPASSMSAEQQLQDIEFGNPDAEITPLETDLQQL